MFKKLFERGDIMRKQILFLSSLVTILLLVVSFSYGHNNSSPNGECYACHSGGTAPAYVNLKGLPDKYIPGGIYNITLTVDSDNQSFGEVQGGFSIVTKGGELGVTDKENTLFSYPYLTHTKEGSNMRQWNFIWRAPGQEMTAEIQVMAVAANGDFSPAGDSVSARVIEIESQ